MKKLALFLMLAFVGYGSLQAGNPFKKNKGIRHLVLIKFRDGISQEQIAKIDTLVWNMRKEIHVIKSLEWGKHIGLSDESQEYDYCLNIVFKSQINMTMYEEHPVHQTFKAALIPLSSKILRFNYLIK